MLLHVARAELRLLSREGLVRALLLLFAAVAAYAASAGAWTIRAQRVASAGAVAEADARLAELRARAADGDATGADAFRVGRELARPVAALPDRPLAAVATGQRELVASVVELTTASRHALARDEAEVASPSARAAGRFDLAFVLVFLLPLLLIALAHDVLSSERERGTLALVLSQPLSLSTFALGKLAGRGLVALGGALLASCAAAAGAVGAAGAAGAAGVAGALEVAAFVGLVAAYGVFWLAAALAVNAWGRSSSGNALALVGLWLVLVIVVPGLLSLAVETVHPTPSRVELVNHVRAETRQAEAAVSAAEGEHGARERYAATQRRALATTAALDARVAPLLDAFRERLAAQQRAVDRLRFLSPAVVLHEALTDVAGASVARHQHFEAQVDDFHARWSAFFAERVGEGRPMTAADHDALPRFAFADEPAARRAGRLAAGLAGLLVPALLLGALAHAGLRRRGFGAERV